MIVIAINHWRVVLHASCWLLVQSNEHHKAPDSAITTFELGDLFRLSGLFQRGSNGVGVVRNVPARRAACFDGFDVLLS